jgi:hypothetical protein
MKIKIYGSAGVGNNFSEEMELPDDTTLKEMEAGAQELATNWPHFEWSVWVIDEDGNEIEASEAFPSSKVPKTSSLTFSEALKAMMANPGVKWTCSALGEGYAISYHQASHRILLYMPNRKDPIAWGMIHQSHVLATDWQVMEVEG